MTVLDHGSRGLGLMRRSKEQLTGSPWSASDGEVTSALRRCTSRTNQDLGGSDVSRDR